MVRAWLKQHGGGQPPGLWGVSDGSGDPHCFRGGPGLPGGRIRLDCDRLAHL